QIIARHQPANRARHPFTSGVTAPATPAGSRRRSPRSRDDAVAVGMAVSEREGQAFAVALEQPRARAGDHRVDEQLELIEQALAQQGPQEGAARPDRDVPARLLL